MAALRFTLRQMEIFSAVARSGSTASAAEEVAISQSAVSAALNDLEFALGVQLFDRIGKKLVLNAVGRSLLARGASMLDSARGIQMDFLSGRPCRHLRLAVSTTIGNYLIPDLLARYAHQCPDHRVDVHIANTAEVLRLVRDCDVDGGAIEGPGDTTGVHLQHWRDDELILVASADHPLAVQQRCSGVRLGRQALENAAWLVREKGSGTRNAMDDALMAYIKPSQPPHVLGSSEAIKQAVRIGLGVSCLSRLIVQDELAKGTLVELSTTVPPLRRTLHLAVHHERQVNAALGLFFGQDPLTRAPATPAPAVLRPHLPCQTLAPTP
ncbi:LysR family transcriptional regulator [Hydrogenophaga sp.]|jgi:DNA-binding transcriptional LysR family regulator|uniref:LysR family transcriptional regulator n=1 Tax=Hydrogenophaga sp. TaxID=1904254 RepID=UPI0035B26134